MNDALSLFSEAMRAAGVPPPPDLVPDGKLRRFPTNGRRDDDSGWAVLYGDDLPAGAFGDWRSGLSETWRADIGRKLTPTEEAQHKARIGAMRRARAEEEAKRQAEAAGKAVEIWKASQPAPESHPYLQAKAIKAHGVRMHQGALVVPVRSDGELHSLQFIGPDGGKKFLTGGRVAGGYFSIGKVAEIVCIAEGFATGATIFEATGHAVAVAFNAGNLEAVARTMRDKFPNARLVVCADDDFQTEGNPGMTKAQEAAQAVGGFVAVPAFGDNRPEKATDFNDLARQCGLESVKACIAAAQEPVDTMTPATCTNWPEPLPLVARVAPEPFPADALPAFIQDAVAEVQGFTKAPVPLVASSALAALSLAVQTHADVKRTERLTGPCGLFFLTIAESGERKSTCDGFFSTALRDFEKREAERLAPMADAFRAKMAGWEAKHSGIKDAIRTAAKTGKDTTGHEADLESLEAAKPEAPKIPRLIFSDATPEALAHSLGTVWPSAAILSSEAGGFFGSHGMNRESIMRNLSLLNQLWDGQPLSFDRRKEGGSFSVRGARLTVALQVQEPTLRDFMERSGVLARGSGFLARFLVSWPESTQGTRFFTEAPDQWPALAEYHRRLENILESPVPFSEEGTLTPCMMELTGEAKAEWVQFHDAIESELRAGGELADLKDVASKAADNAARLSCLFHVAEHGPVGAISHAAFIGASRIVAWHLSEARRFLGELAISPALSAAIKLEGWLIDQCRQQGLAEISRRTIQQRGPGIVRNGAALDVALKELADLGRVRMTGEGGKPSVEINPALLAGGGQ